MEIGRISPAQARLYIQQRVGSSARWQGVLDTLDRPSPSPLARARTQAIPPEQQQRSPSLPGEAVYAQTGYMCVVENLPASSYTLVAAAAVQVLAQGRLRLHAVITTECWRSEGNRLMERWRASHECDEEGSESVVDGVLAELSEQVRRLRPVVDQERGQAPST
ncbi:hypothetical protein ACFRAO_41065 [Streptomyces sp. NPDC056656]|uniref:hypothetical protein n=1 Tax=Streptomyces sp. NPDC056656 TaxID=3345895 RepID=UPI0036B33D98